MKPIRGSQTQAQSPESQTWVLAVYDLLTCDTLRIQIITAGGGDALNVAEAFLLAQYSESAYWKVDKVIKRFARRSSSLDNPAGWLYTKLVDARHDLQDEQGMEADYDERIPSASENIHHEVTREEFSARRRFHHRANPLE